MMRVLGLEQSSDYSSCNFLLHSVFSIKYDLSNHIPSLRTGKSEDSAISYIYVFVKLKELGFCLMKMTEERGILRQEEIYPEYLGEAGARKVGRSQIIIGLYTQLRSLDFIIENEEPLEDFKKRTDMDIYFLVRLTQE